MIRKDDVRWWVLEAREHPEAAPAIIEELAGRLLELDAENERLRNEAILAGHRPSQAADTSETAALRARVAELEALVAAASPEHFLVLLSSDLRASRLPLAQVPTMSAESAPSLEAGALTGLRGLVLACSGESVLVLTNRGRGRIIGVSEVPPVEEGAVWPSDDEEDLPDLPAGEWLAASTAAGRQPRFWTVVTRRGFVRQFVRVSFERDASRGEHIMDTPLPRDEPRVIVSGEEDDLLIVTRWGKGLRFPRRAIPTQGTVAIELDTDDEVAAALPIESEADVLIVTAAGFAVRRNAASVKAMQRPGGAGGRLISAFDVLAVFPYVPDSRVLLLTHSGRLILAHAADVPATQRLGKGTCLADLNRDPALATVNIPAAAWPQI